MYNRCINVYIETLVYMCWKQWKNLNMLGSLCSVAGKRLESLPKTSLNNMHLLLIGSGPYMALHPTRWIAQNALNAVWHRSISPGVPKKMINKANKDLFSMLSQKNRSLKRRFLAFLGGPGGFRKLREAYRNHFHLSWYLLVPGIASMTDSH